jgi:outer membrane protein OmpA-like peptidoglycan-associated protein
LVNVTKEGYAPKQVLIITKNDKQLYTVYLEKSNGQLVTGVLKNDRGLPVPGAMVTITDPETGETQTVTTDAEGKYTFVAKPNKKYAITGNKPNHDPFTSTFETKDNIPKEMAFESKMKELVSPLKKGRVFELTNVYYNFNDASLRPDAKRDLEALVTIMNAYPEVEIELGSHTDCRGSDAYNDDLSTRRANSVVRYLVDHGVTKSRVLPKGYGEHQLRNQCADGVECTEEEHQRNRRTEVMITKSASNAEIVVVNKEPEYTDPMPGRRVGGPAIADGGANSNSSNSTNHNDNSEDNSTVSSNMSSDPNGTFWIVAGSFNNQQNAVEQQVRLKNKGLQETTVEFMEESHFYRVVVNKQSSIEAATSVARDLKDKGVKDLFVVKNGK